MGTPRKDVRLLRGDSLTQLEDDNNENNDAGMYFHLVFYFSSFLLRVTPSYTKERNNKNFFHGCFI